MLATATRRPPFPAVDERPRHLTLDFKGQADVVVLFYCYDWGGSERRSWATSAGRPLTSSSARPSSSRSAETAPSHTQNSIDGTGSRCAPQRRASDGHTAYDVWDRSGTWPMLDVHRRSRRACCAGARPAIVTWSGAAARSSRVLDLIRSLKGRTTMTTARGPAYPAIVLTTCVCPAPCPRVLEAVATRDEPRRRGGSPGAPRTPPRVTIGLPTQVTCRGTRSHGPHADLSADLGERGPMTAAISAAVAADIQREPGRARARSGRRRPAPPEHLRASP